MVGAKKKRRKEMAGAAQSAVGHWDSEGQRRGGLPSKVQTLQVVKVKALEVVLRKCPLGRRRRAWHGGLKLQARQCPPRGPA